MALKEASALDPLTCCIFKKYKKKYKKKWFQIVSNVLFRFNSRRYTVVDGVLVTSRPKYILHGITRSNIIKVARRAGMEVREDDFSLTTVYSADEAFVTGTFAGLMPVTEVDGRTIGSGRRGATVEKLQGMYLELVREEAARGRRAVEAPR